VKDGRDAFLDSGLLIKDGSFKTFVMPEVGIGFDPGAGGIGVGGEGASGTIVIGSHDGHITVTPPAGASGPVEVIVTPSDTIEIPGAGGPGKPVIVTFNPGDGPKDVPIQAAPGAGTGDTGTVHYEVVSTDPNVNGQPIAPDVFGFELPANRPPEITSPTGEIHVTENTTNVAQVVAVDPDAGQTLTYSIEGGADKDLFTIDPATGALKFKAAPDFEHPTDAGADNVYDVVVGVKDNGAVPMSDTQALAVRVTDAAETSTLVVKFVSESAGYRNAVGWYNTETLKGGILFPSIEAEGKHPTVIPGVTTASFVVDNADVGKIGFFLIPDGGRVQGDDDRHEHRNHHLRDDDDCGDSDGAPGGPIKVVQLVNGTWAVALVDAAGNVQTDRHGKPVMLEGVGANALFTETSKNAGGVDYASSKVGSGQTAAALAGDTADGPAGLLAWEDQAAHRLSNGSYGKPGDADYNDAVLQVDQVMGRTLNGDDGPNNLNGGIAGDVLYGWGGKDAFDAGAGSDRASGGDDDDLFIHRIAENAGSSDSYDGGAGLDTLRLVLTGSEWARQDVQADIAKFLAYLEPAQNPAGVAQSFSFKSTDLTTVNIESWRSWSTASRSIRATSPSRPATTACR